jgi:hypothetical protein
MGLLTGRYRKGRPKARNARMNWVPRHLTAHPHLSHLSLTQRGSRIRGMESLAISQNDRGTVAVLAADVGRRAEKAAT